VHTVQTLEVGSPDGVTLDLNNVAEATLINQDGQLILTGEDGHGNLTLTPTHPFSVVQSVFTNSRCFSFPEYAVKLCNVDKLWQGHGAALDSELKRPVMVPAKFGGGGLTFVSRPLKRRKQVLVKLVGN